MVAEAERGVHLDGKFFLYSKSYLPTFATFQAVDLGPISVINQSAASSYINNGLNVRPFLGFIAAF